MASLGSENIVVIVGASHAGVAVAEALRKGGFGGEVILLDRESGLPSERPPLSKAWLTEGGEFLLRQADWFKDNAIDFRSDCEVVSGDSEARSITLKNGEEIKWDRLVLATGATPRTLADFSGSSVYLLRTPSDAKALSAAFDKGGKLAVIGGGYIGLEVAASARKRGLEVVVFEQAERLLARVASRKTSAFFEDLHKSHDVEIVTSTNITSFEQQGDKVLLASDKDKWEVRSVLVGIGVMPNISLGESLGLEVGDGFLVNSHYETSQEGIFAIGDTALPQGGYTEGKMRIESVHHAQMSAEIAAAALLSDEGKPHEVPWFWSDQYDCKLQSAGIVPQEAEVITREGEREGAISFWSFADGKLVAVEAINFPQAYMIGRAVLSDNLPLTANQVADPNYDLKQLIKR